MTRASSGRLRRTQLWMMEAITGTAPPEHPERMLRGDSRMSATARLHVYRHAYRARLVECLRNDYPGLALLMGDAFEGACLAYLEAQPPTGPTLNTFGARFGAYLGAGDGWGFDVAMLVDCAAVEWAIVEVIHRAAPRALDPSALQVMPPGAWGTVRVERAPGLAWIPCSHDVNAFLDAALTGEAAATPAKGPNVVVVSRNERWVYRHTLNAWMCRLLGMLFAGDTLGVALTSLAESLTPKELEDVTARIFGDFASWTRAGLFASLRSDLDRADQLGLTQTPW